MNGTDILSGILAIIIALTSMCGGLMNSGAGQPVSAEISVNVDGDLSMLGVDGQSEEVTAAVTKLLSVLSIRLSADADAGQFQVKLAGDPVSSLSVKKQDDGWAAVSSLFPSTMLTVKNETLTALTSAAGSSAALPGNVDQEAILAAVQAPFDEMMEAFRQKTGDPETGSFALGGVEFSRKTPYNITTKEALVLILTAVRTIANDEKIAALLAQAAPDYSPESLDQSLEDLKNQDESELPVLSVAEYGNDAGDTAFELSLEREGQLVSILSVTSGQVTRIDISVQDQMNASLVLDEENKEYSLDLSFSAYEGTITLKGSLKVQDERSDLEALLTMPAGGGIPMSLKISAAITGDAPVFEAAEGLKEIALETLMQDEDAQTAVSTEVSQSLMLMMLKISKEYPEIVTIMTPSGAGQGTVVEEAPAAETPTEDVPVVETPVEEVPDSEAPAA